MNDFEKDHLYPFYVMIRTDGRYNVHHLIKGLSWGPYDSWGEAHDEATKLKGQEYRGNLWPYSDDEPVEVDMSDKERKKRYKKEVTKLFCEHYGDDDLIDIDRSFIKKATKLMMKAYKEGRDW